MLVVLSRYGSILRRHSKASSFDAAKGCIDFVTLSLLQNSFYVTELKCIVARHVGTPVAYETQYCRCKRISCMMDERGVRRRSAGGHRAVDLKL